MRCRVYPTTSGDTCLSVRDAFGTNGIPIPFAVLDALNPGECKRRSSSTSTSMKHGYYVPVGDWPLLHVSVFLSSPACTYTPTLL